MLSELDANAMSREPIQTEEEEEQLRVSLEQSVSRVRVDLAEGFESYDPDVNVHI